jgi:peptidoglycan/LPS O-acetylase OafA/YrhL
MKYKPEIDGLRGISVLAVIIYHLNSRFLINGFLGVDVFFVISGFLITSIISEKINSGSFSILNFYERRIKRLLPVYFLIVLIFTLFAIIIMLPYQLKDYFQSIASSVLFLSNYFFYYESDYFAPSSEFYPLVHTWSLSIEEQFYLFYPLFLILINKYFKRSISYILAILVILSLTYSIYLEATNPSLGFYSLGSRFWELGSGGLFATLSLNSTFARKKSRKWEILCGFSFLILLALFFDISYLPSNLQLSFAKILVCLSSGILILNLEKSVLLSRLLRGRFLLKMGILSYSLYMFHQPILALLKTYYSNYYGQEELPLWNILMAVVLIFITAWISYTYFENPIRYSTIKMNRTFGIAFLFIISASTFGYIGHKSNGLLKWYLKRNNEVIFINRDEEKRKALEELNKYDANKLEQVEGLTNILVIGDSFGKDLFVSLKKNSGFNNNGISYINLDDTCMESFLQTDESFKCNNEIITTEEILDRIKANDIVIISAYWSESTYLSGFGMAKSLTNNEKKIFLTGSISFSDISTIAIMKKNYSNDDDFRHAIYEKFTRKDKLLVSDKLKLLVNNDSSLYFIDKSKFFCDDKAERCNLFDEDANPLIWDNAHLTTIGFIKFGEFLNEEILR